MLKELKGNISMMSYQIEDINKKIKLFKKTKQKFWN